MSKVRPSGRRPEQHLTVVSERIPPPSQANDLIVVMTTVIAAVAGVVFAVTLLLGTSISVYGTALAIGLLSLAIAVRRFFTDHFPDVEAVEPRESPRDEEDAPLADVPLLGRRPLLRRLLIGASGVLGISLLSPIPSLGPSPREVEAGTGWTSGRRLVTTDGDPLRPEDVASGGISTVWPEGFVGREISAVILVRLSGQEPTEPTKLEWVVNEALIAYSKVCTHAGCPVGLFREQDNALFCPCHQSTFNARRGAVPTFGPAARALPQLPLGVDDEGFLVALGDFTEQVGPAYG